MQCYGVQAPVIYPPVNVERFEINGKPSEDFFLVVSRLVSYKKIDLAIEACTQLGKKLVVIGDGPDRKRLEANAGPTVTFLGRKSDKDVTDYMQRCKALFFPGIEDFGITPLEVNACGRPIIAFADGGALDTVSPEVTGLFFRQQTPEALMAVIEDFDNYEWNPQVIREHAEKFNEVIFMDRLKSAIEGLTEKTETSPTKIQIGVEF
jgi:glycosyltransferase involved in cell wall biosynthesis